MIKLVMSYTEPHTKQWFGLPCHYYLCYYSNQEKSQRLLSIMRHPSTSKFVSFKWPFVRWRSLSRSAPNKNIKTLQIPQYTRIHLTNSWCITSFLGVCEKIKFSSGRTIFQLDTIEMLHSQTHPFCMTVMILCGALQCLFTPTIYCAPM